MFEGEYDLSEVLSALDRRRICEVAHKPFPSGRATHGIVDACLELKRAHGFTAADVEAVTASVPPLVHQLVARPVHESMAVNYARLCASYVAARALQFDSVGVGDFYELALGDPETRSLARRFEIAIDDNPDRNALTPITVAIALRDGTRCDKTLDAVYGSPANPMTREAHLDKFYRNWRSGCEPLPPEAGAALVAAVDDLESVADVAELVDLLIR